MFKYHRCPLRAAYGKALWPNVACSIYVQSADLITFCDQDLGGRHDTQSQVLSCRRPPYLDRPTLNLPNTAPSSSPPPHETLTLLLVQLFSVQ